jgi:hypothetical protein
MALLGRARNDAALPDIVGAAFIFAGKSKADEDEVIRRTSGGRDSNGNLYPIPSSIYETIRGERSRPLLALVLWHVETANDASLLAIASAMASVFFES